MRHIMKLLAAMILLFAIAKELNARGNMVLLGAAAPYLEIAFEELEKAIKAIFGRKGDAVVETNIKAIRAGRDAK